MTRKNQIRRSGTRLQRQGALWFEQTRNAGETFFEESRAASTTFTRDITAASNKLAAEWTRPAEGVRKALRTDTFE